MKSARERSKPVSQQSCRNDRSIEASSKRALERQRTERRKSSWERARKKISEVARRICILIRNLAESFLRSPSFPILFYTASQSPKDRRRLLALLPLPPSLHPPSLPALSSTFRSYSYLITLDQLIPGAAGPNYHDRKLYSRGRCQLRRRDATRQWGETRNEKLKRNRISQAGSDSNLNFFFLSSEQVAHDPVHKMFPNVPYTQPDQKDDSTSQLQVQNNILLVVSL